MIDHVNVLKLKEVYCSNSKIFIVLDLVRGGDLCDKISSLKQIPEAMAKLYFKQIC